MPIWFITNIGLHKGNKQKSRAMAGRETKDSKFHDTDIYGRTCLFVKMFSRYIETQSCVICNYNFTWVMAIWVVEFSNRGTKLESFLPKNQHIQGKLLNFEYWIK